MKNITMSQLAMLAEQTATQNEINHELYNTQQF
jgi:hypothetical protein